MSKTAKSIILAGVIGAALGVAFGAFGAHGLKQVLSASSLQIYKTGVHYQMWHSISLIVLGLTFQHMLSSRLLAISAWFMFSGIVLFSGSLYSLALTGLGWFGVITPLGGLCFLIAWTLFALAIIRYPSDDHS